MLFDPIFYQKRQVNFPEIPPLVLPKLDTFRSNNIPVDSLKQEPIKNEDDFQRKQSSADLLKSVDTKPSSYLSYNYSPEESKRFSFNEKKILYSPFKDMEDIYAQQQTTSERLSNAYDTYNRIALDNALLTFKSLYAGVRDLDYKSIMDNEFVTELAKTMENIDIENPIFISAKERENGLDFSTWMLKTAPQAGFTVGAILDMILLEASLTLIGAAAGIEGGPVGAAVGGGVGAITGLVRGGTRLYSGIKNFAKLAASGRRLSEVVSVAKATNSALHAAQYVRQAATLANLGRLSAYTTKGMLMSSSEAALEREMYFRQARNQFAEDFKVIHGYDPSEEDLDKASYKIASAANEIYAANMALLTASNMVQFPSILRGTIGSKMIRSVPLVFKKEAGQLVAKGLNTKKFLFDGVTDIVKGAAAEGLEEWGQEVIGESTRDYYRNLINGRIKVGDRLETLKEGISKNLSEKGFDTFLSGAVIGSGFSVVGAVTDYTGLKVPWSKNRYFKHGARSLAKSYSDKIDKEGVLFNSAVRDVNIGLNIDEAAKAQDEFKLNNAMHDRLFNFMTTAIKTDSFDIRLSEIEDLKDLSLDDFLTLAVGKTQSELSQEGIEYTEADKNKYINNLVSQANNIKNVYKSVETLFSVNAYKKDAVQKLVDTKLFTKEQASNVADNLWEDYKYILANTISRGENIAERRDVLKNNIADKLSYPLFNYSTLDILTSPNVKKAFIEKLKEELKLVKDGILPSDVVKKNVIEKLLEKYEKANSFAVFEHLTADLTENDKIILQDIGRMDVYLQAVQKGNSINNINKQKKEYSNLIEQLILIKKTERKVESTNNLDNPSEVKVTDPTNVNNPVTITTEDQLEKVEEMLDQSSEEAFQFNEDEIQFINEQNLSPDEQFILAQLIRSNSLNIIC